MDDTQRINWLNDQVVDVIYLDDGRIVDVRGLDVREALDREIASNQAITGSTGYCRVRPRRVNMNTQEAMIILERQDLFESSDKQIAIELAIEALKQKAAYEQKRQAYFFDGQWLGSVGGQLVPLGMTEGTREEALAKMEEMKP